jgi:para-nitrobenzyl esterase
MNLPFLLSLLVFVQLLPAYAVPVALIDQHDLLVRTQSGPVLGKYASGSKRWLGIPFAAPPVAALRFRSPQPVTPWSQTLSATENPPACMQADGERVVYGARSEDCLYLNIFAPLTANASSSLPVMFWIYGGSFLAGGIAFEEYDGAKDAITNDMIVVTSNYRLGPFGFLASELLRDNRGSVGNYGIEDQREAMKWTRDNIAFFGGDASRMMIFGESAGAASVGVHLVSPLSTGLFSSAGMESGSGLAHWSATSMDDAKAVFQRTLVLANCTGAHDVVQCLRQVDALTLASVTMACGLCSGPVKHGSALHFAPTVDGFNLPAAPWDLAKQGKIAAVPQLVGTNHDEATFFLSSDKSLRALTLSNLTSMLTSLYGANVTSTLLKLYPVPSSDFPLPYWALVSIYTDSSMACPARQAARAAVAIGQQAFLYQFSHVPLVSSPDKWLRAYHSCELAYVFQWDVELLTPGERSLAATMAALWGNMAKFGSPSSALWPAYNTTDEYNILFDARLDEVRLTVQQHLKASVCDFWDSLPYTPHALCLLDPHSSRANSCS